MSSQETKPSSFSHIGTLLSQGDRFEVYTNLQEDLYILCYIGTGVSSSPIEFTYEELDHKLQSQVDKLVLKQK